MTVRLTSAALAALPEILGDTTSAARPTPDPEDGWHRLVLRFDDPRAACRRLLGFGPDLEVLEPAEVRQRSADSVRRGRALPLALIIAATPEPHGSSARRCHNRTRSFHT
ncbi:WYL domain-containing protein [Streptomyces coeruleorubidus]